MLLSALCFSLMGVCVKAIGAHLPAAEVVLARAVVSLALSWWMLQRSGIAPWGRRRGLLMLRGALGSVALLCVYAALAVLPLAAATVLQYLYPTFTALMAWLMLGERIGRRLLLASALGWLGVVLVAHPMVLVRLSGWRPEHQLLPAALPPGLVLIAVAGALFTALAYVSVRSLGRSEHPLVIVFYFPLMALPLSLPLVLLDPVWPTPAQWGWLLGVGVFTQLGQIWLTQGLTALPAAQASALSYIQVLFAGLWGWWIFSEPVSFWTAGGAALILAASALCLPRATQALQAPQPSRGKG